jgi:hypothetical protein
VGPRAVLDAVVKRKFPSPSWESNLRTPIVQPVAQRYTDLITEVVDKVLVISPNRNSFAAIHRFGFSNTSSQITMIL